VAGKISKKDSKKNSKVIEITENLLVLFLSIGGLKLFVD